jgi:ATP-binding cassette subfamily B protein
MKYIQQLHFLFDRKDKTNLLLLVLFSIFVSLMEAVGISIIMPFIDVATNFSTIESNKYYKAIYTFFGFETELNFAISFGFVLVAFYVFRAIITILYTYTISNFSNTLRAKLKQKVFNKCLIMPYKEYVTRNQALLNKTINSETSGVGIIFFSVLQLIVEIFTIIFLYSLMLIASWKITLAFTVVLGGKLLFLIKPLATKIKQIGVEREQIEARFSKLFHRSFRNFKYLKLQSLFFLKDVRNQFASETSAESKISIKQEVLVTMPRLFLETTGFSMIVLLLVYLLFKHQGSVLHILPVLSLFVLALYRLLPSVNRIILAYNTILFHHRSLEIVSDEMKSLSENIGTDIISFTKKIELNNVSFNYQDGTQALKNINLTINKGEKIAFIGESGSGKSTLADLIIGLYQPITGDIKIDSQLVGENNIQNWRSQVGYIPQQGYLFDGTVADNIYFGRVENTDKLEEVLKQANIFDFLQTKNGIETLVGEGGVQLSGGQQQRIAIARALYGNPNILVLDEATSALDNETEQKIMNEIYEISKDKTLIIIAHRLSTIEGCEKIYKVINGTFELKV